MSNVVAENLTLYARLDRILNRVLILRPPTEPDFQTALLEANHLLLHSQSIRDDVVVIRGMPRPRPIERSLSIFGRSLWRKVLLAHWAEMNCCVALLTTRSAILVGREHNVECVWRTYEFLSDALSALRDRQRFSNGTTATAFLEATTGRILAAVEREYYRMVTNDSRLHAVVFLFTGENEAFIAEHYPHIEPFPWRGSLT